MPRAGGDVTPPPRGGGGAFMGLGERDRFSEDKLDLMPEEGEGEEPCLRADGFRDCVTEGP